jgi:type IV pilus assembly protein PilN
VVIGLLGVFWFINDRRHAALEKERDLLAAEEKRLQKRVGEVKQLEREKAELQDKLGKIELLEAKRTGPVRIMDEISDRIPPQKAWLVNLVQKNNQLTLKGVAIDNETIALFMGNLEDSEFLRKVELVRSAQEIRNEIRLKSFSITCEIVIGEEKTPGEDGDKKKDV